ncbi:hypothetical protein D3C72_1642820 [compost metagenome]
MGHGLQLLLGHRKGFESLARALDRQQLGGFVAGPHELLAGNDGAIGGNRQVAHAVHLLAQHLFAQQGAVALHQHQARLHGIEVHFYPALSFGANATVGHHQGFTVRHP